MTAENSKMNPQKTLLTISTGLIVLFLIFKFKWLLTAALVVGIIGITSDWLSEKIEWAWMKLAWVLSLIMPNILLSIIFFLVLTPVAFLNRLFGKKDPLMLKPQKESLYRSYQKSFDQAYFEKHW